MKAKTLLLLSIGLLAGACAAAQPMTRGFRGVELGMSLEQVTERLVSDPLFGYRGEPDVSLLPSAQQTLIESTGSSWVRRSFFQFQDGRLFSIILMLDPQRLDYYTLYETLTRKYGNCARLNPSEAVWDFSGVRLSLERPLAVKYLDTAVFERLREEGKAGESMSEMSKKMFLEQF